MARRLIGEAAILDAARQAFASKGYDGTSIRDIAEAAGVSLSALYYYYPSKYEALYALVLDAFDHYFAESGEALESAGDDARNQLDALVRHLVMYRVKNAAQSKLLLQEADKLHGEGATLVRKKQIESNDRFHAVINLGVEQGHFETPYPDDCVRAIISMCNAISMWYRPGGSLKVKDLQDRYSHFAFEVAQCSAPPIPVGRPRRARGTASTSASDDAASVVAERPAPRS
ncbi:TetR/AcrR family transcriptional regulator [Rhodococcus olei]|uniref:TetR/AcrR family transcriptional regulator n=1 Tax=Rhodococcus olei TaxID=2161675 RepID=A0ABP8NYI8_9NOCA